jgi:hypothetical protein
MKDGKRRVEARKRAEGYAPRPLSSVFMYGIVGACLAGLAWAAFTGFYGLDPFAHPLWLAAALLLAFAGALMLRIVRDRRHHAAHRREYARTDPRMIRKRKDARRASERR